MFCPGRVKRLDVRAGGPPLHGCPACLPPRMGGRESLYFEERLVSLRKHKISENAAQAPVFALKEKPEQRRHDTKHDPTIFNPSAKIHIVHHE